jgi:chromate transport protein ChrA
MLSYVYGVSTGAVATLFIVFAYDGRMRIPWYSWVLLALALVVTGIAIETMVGSLRERERRAAWMSLATLGGPSVVFWAAALSTMSFMS